MRDHLPKIAFVTGILIVMFVLSVPMISAEEKLMGKTVNINRATAEELAKVPLISPKLAQAIVAYREEVGEFQFVEELLLIEGFDRDLFSKVKPFFILEGLGGDACTC